MILCLSVLFSVTYLMHIARVIDMNVSSSIYMSYIATFCRSVLLEYISSGGLTFLPAHHFVQK